MNRQQRANAKYKITQIEVKTNRIEKPIRIGIQCDHPPLWTQFAKGRGTHTNSLRKDSAFNTER